MMENGLAALPGGGGFPQISGFKVTYRAANPVGSRVRAIALDGGAAVARDSTSYTLALPDFVNNGGDGYTMLAGGDGTPRDLMTEVLADRLKASGTLTPSTSGRMVAVP
jgi:5'-nucleotidase